MALRFLWITTLAAPLAVLAAPAGFVLDLRGEWRLEGTATALSVGAEIPAGGVLRAGAPQARDSITIVASRTGQVLLAKKCAAPKDCEGPVPVPLAASDGNAPGAMAALLEKVAARLRGNPSRYVATITRSERVLADSVLELSGGSLMPAPALAAASPGTYQVALRPLACPPGRDCATVELASDYPWSAASATPLAAPGVSPGLFALEVARAGTEFLPSPGIAWVRLSTGARYANDAATFQSARDLAAGWGSAVDPAARQSFLRGVLASLDD